MSVNNELNNLPTVEVCYHNMFHFLVQFLQQQRLGQYKSGGKIKLEFNRVITLKAWLIQFLAWRHKMELDIRLPSYLQSLR